ncbi:MAG: dipeptidase [Alphaproteobacteria bacterium]
MSTSAPSSPAISIDALAIPFPQRHIVERWRTGGVGCVHATVTIWGDARETMSLIGRWQRLIAENRDLMEGATSGEDIERIAASGRVAIVLGFQNTSPIEHDIELFRVFRELGICIMQLTYNLQNFIGAGCWEQNDTGISSRFGRLAIEEMNKLGILIDVSHSGDRTSREAIDLSARPISITHANPREYVGTAGFGAHRLKATDAIKACAARGGVIGLSPNPHMTKQGIDTTPDQFCDMVKWMVDLVGIDHVGIGTDYCPGHPPGTRERWRFGKWSRSKIDKPIPEPGEGWQDWFKTSEDFQVLRTSLEANGFSPADTDKIMGGNFLRLFTESFRPTE